VEVTSVRQWVGFAALSLGLVAGIVMAGAWLLMTFVMKSCGC